MSSFLWRRLLLMIPTLVLISIVSFVIIQLPPGDFLTSYVAELESQGGSVDTALLESLRDQYGLGQPVHQQYLKWITGIFKGQFGMSLYHLRPVEELIWERLALTLSIGITSIAIIWLIALPVGIYSAVKQYSLLDYLATAFSFIGLGIPSFLLGLVIMWFALSHLGQNVTGLFSVQFQNAPWSFAKLVDLLKHIWIPALVLAFSGTAGLIRVMRANLLDELRRPYVMAARANGLSERKLLLKYPVRVALNPFISTLGWTLPQIISNSMLISVVLNLPTTGTLLLRALLGQDMYLAGAIMLMLGILTVIGTLISDLLLMLIDPRIRYQ